MNNQAKNQSPVSSSRSIRSRVKPSSPAPSSHRRLRDKSQIAQEAETSIDPTLAFQKHARDMYCVLDETLLCISASNNWPTFTGYTAQEQTGDGFQSRIAPEHVDKVIECITHPSHSPQPLRFQVKHKDGHWRWLEIVHKERLKDSATEHPMYACLMHDVTQLVATQGRLERAKFEAELATKSRSEFLANMSHELRTPLNAILGFAQMMGAGTHGVIEVPKYQEYIQNIQESGTALLYKISDLMEIANIDSGRLELQESETDVVSVMRLAMEFHTHHAFSRQVKFVDHLPTNPVMANVDRVRMLQIFSNILSNAIKYNTPQGTVNIGIQERADGGINVIVEDTGEGIPSVQLQNILNAFRKDKSFFARTRDCMGLGLALSKELVKLHNGYIDIKSESGKGTMVTVRLPKERRVHPAESAQREATVA